VTAGVLSIKNIFWPLTANPKTSFTGYLDSTLMGLFIIGVVLVVANAAVRISKTLRGEPIPQEAFGPPEPQPEGVVARCC
jgi:carbon starvation protein